MRTKVNIKSHSLHQMLIPFPIAFLFGACVFDLLGLLLSDSNLHRTSFYLGVSGVLTGVAAAGAGLIDFIFTVPPKSSGKKRGLKHMIVNLSSVALFTLAVVVRDKIFWIPDATIIGLESVGVVLLGIGGWMGGTLVNRNFIGPDHRYANAGKWKEISFREKKSEYIVASEDELKIDQMKLVKIKGQRIVICRTEDGFTAFDDHCTHRGGSLADGVAICGTVHCLWHGSQFNVKTGEVKSGPANEPIKTYLVMINEGKVILKV